MRNACKFVIILVSFQNAIGFRPLLKDEDPPRPIDEVIVTRSVSEEIGSTLAGVLAYASGYDGAFAEAVNFENIEN